MIGALNRWILLLFITAVLSACSPEHDRPSPTYNNGAETTEDDEGSATDVGNGGKILDLRHEWQTVTTDYLVENIRRIFVVPGLTYSDFTTIKAMFENIVKTTSVQFVDYPLFLEAETSSNRSPTLGRYTSMQECNFDIELNPGVDESVLDERLRDAINFNTPSTIKVDKKRFACALKEGHGYRVNRLVLHEYLGRLGYDEIGANGEVNYAYSNAILKAIEDIEDISPELQVIEVRTCEDLQKVGLPLGHESWNKDAHPEVAWALSNNINCTESSSWNDGQGFTPRLLNGVFYGRGYSIRNLVIQPSRTPSTYVDGVALFASSCRRCNISHVNLEHINVKGNAALVAINYSDISDVSISGTIKSPVPWAGGIVAINFGGNIKKSVARVTLEANLFAYEVDDISTLENSLTSPGIRVGVGGLVGVHLYGSLNNSFSQSDVTANNFVGGLAGRVERARVFVNTSYSTVTARYSNTSTAGILIGYMDGNEVKDSFAYGTLNYYNQDPTTNAHSFRNNPLIGLNTDNTQVVNTSAMVKLCIIDAAENNSSCDTVTIPFNAP